MLSMIAWIGLFLIVSFALLSTIILVSPLKYMLPGYAEMSIRENVINDGLRIDTIQTKLTNSDRQLLILKNVIAGNIDIDSISSADSLTIEQLKSLPLGPTKQEQHFVNQYEEANKYNINDYIHTETRSEEMVFVQPVHGAITNHFNDKNNSSITIATTPDKPVLASQSGKIIYASHGTIIIGHNAGFTTVYRNLSRLLHKTNDNVSAGEAIAFVGGDEQAQPNNTIDFELWYDGSPTDPEKYIVF